MILMSGRPAGACVTARHGKYRRLVMGTVLVFSCGCATLASPSSTQRVVVSSDPPGAQLLVDGQPAGVTPTAVELGRRARETTLRLEKDGFLPDERSVRRSISRWLLADVAFMTVTSFLPGGGDAGPPAPRIAVGLSWVLGLEYLTGAAFRLPKSIDAKLTPAPAGMRRRPDRTVP